MQISQEHLEMNDPMEDAWGEICPETERERVECAEEKGEREDSEARDEIIPDLLSPVEAFCTFEPISNMMPKEDAFTLLYGH